MTWVIRSRSPWTMTESSGISASTSSPRSVIFFSMDSRAIRADSQRSNSSFFISLFCIWEISSIRRTRRLRRRLSSEMI